MEINKRQKSRFHAAFHVIDVTKKQKYHKSVIK